MGAARLELKRDLKNVISAFILKSQMRQKFRRVLKRASEKERS